MEIWALGISVTVGIAVLGSFFWLGNWHGSVNSDRKAFKEFMQEIRQDIKKIFERLPAPTTASSSPIRLTEVGTKISRKLDARAWAKAEAEKLFDKTAGADAFGIQETAFEYARNFEPPEKLLGKMRDSAFERDVDLGGVREVLGVELRDVLLDHHGIDLPSLDSGPE